MKFSVTPKCFFISALVFAAVLMFAACSGEKAAGSVSLELPGRSAFSRDAASMYVTVFITGDYQDKQTFAMDDDGLTVTFDSVPSGASIRVACALTFENQEGNDPLHEFGVSEKITVQAGTEQSVAVGMRSMGISYSGSTVRLARYFEGGEAAFSSSDLPGCKYKFKFENASGALSGSSSSPSYDFGSLGVSEANSGANTVIILCEGTEVIKLYKRYEA